MTDSINKEHKTKAGETLAMFYPDTSNAAQPYAVALFDENDETRWHLNFATEEKAQAEYDRWSSY